MYETYHTCCSCRVCVYCECNYNLEIFENLLHIRQKSSRIKPNNMQILDLSTKTVCTDFLSKKPMTLFTAMEHTDKGFTKLFISQNTNFFDAHKNTKL